MNFCLQVVVQDAGHQFPQQHPGKGLTPASLHMQVKHDITAKICFTTRACVMSQVKYDVTGKTCNICLFYYSLCNVTGMTSQVKHDVTGESGNICFTTACVTSQVNQATFVLLKLVWRHRYNRQHSFYYSLCDGFHGLRATVLSLGVLRLCEGLVLVTESFCSPSGHCLSQRSTSSFFTHVRSLQVWNSALSCTANTVTGKTLEVPTTASDCFMLPFSLCLCCLLCFVRLAVRHWLFCASDLCLHVILPSVSLEKNISQTWSI